MFVLLMPESQVQTSLEFFHSRTIIGSSEVPKYRSGDHQRSFFLDFLLTNHIPTLNRPWIWVHPSILSSALADRSCHVSPHLLPLRLKTKQYKFAMLRMIINGANSALHRDIRVKNKIQPSSVK